MLKNQIDASELFIAAYIVRTIARGNKRLRWITFSQKTMRCFDLTDTREWERFSDDVLIGI